MWNVRSLTTKGASVLAVAMFMALPACTDKTETAAIDPAQDPAAALPVSNDPNYQPAAAKDQAGNPISGQPGVAPTTPVAPYRTFLTIQRYTLEQSGNAKDAIHNVRLEVTFPNGGKLQLPEGGQYWPVGERQVQEINRTYEIPWTYLQAADGFKFKIQMVRKGFLTNACEFDVAKLSEFNRSYICKTDVGWQNSQGIPEDKLAIEGLQVRVFSDRNSKPNEIPQQASIAAAK